MIATIGGSRTARNLETTSRGRLRLGSLSDVIMIDVTVSDSRLVNGAEPDLIAGFTTTAGWNQAEEEGSWT